MSTLASLLIELGIDTGRLQGDLGKANRQVETAFDGMSRSAAKLGAAMGVLSTGVVAVSLDRAAQAAMEGEQAINRLDAVIRATGNTSGYTRDQLHQLADAMAETTQFDDESIRGATATILKFGNVHGKVLEDALRLSADYAAFTGTDMTSASEALGRAIASPAQGIERLQRSIGYLNPAQVEAIKTMQELGDVAGAQAAVIQILQQKIGGTAETMNTGYTKAFGDAKKATGEFWEALGNAAPVQATVQSFLSFVTTSMRDLKHIIEDGDWVQAFKFLVGFRQSDDQVAARRQPAGLPKPADSAAALAAELQRRQEFQRALAEQDARAIEGALKRQKKASEDRTREAYQTAQLIQAGEEDAAREAAEAWAYWDKFILDQEKKATAERIALGDAYVAAQEIDAKTTAEAWQWYFHYLHKAQVDAQEAFRDTWGGLFENISSGFTSMFDDMLDGRLRDWEDFAHSLGDIFKRSVVDMVGNAIRGMMNNLMNSLSQGNFSLSGMLNGINPYALAAGGGSIAGALINGALGSGARGQQIGTMAGGAGAMLGFYLGGPIGAVIGAIGGSLLGHFMDPDGLAQRSATFGPTAGAQGLTGYTYTSPFGTFGLSDTSWFSDQDMGEDLRRYFAGMANWERQIAGFLTPEEIVRVTGALGTSGRYGFGEEHGDFSATLGEMTADRASVILGAVDPYLQSLIEGFQGTGEELGQFVLQLLGMRQALADMNITGLNMETLGLMSRAGETLADTFQRVANQWSWFTSNFYTEAEQLAMAETQVNGVFESLGIAVPGSVTEFRKLVEGLDLSTEAGRTMFQILMGVAPAFLQVANAADGATSSTEDLNRALEEQAELQRRIADDVRSSRQRQLDNIIGARSGLERFLNGTRLNSSLTVLTPQERLAEARRQYEEVLALARGGDLGAAGRLGGVADTYLQIARELYASSSSYVGIFNRVTADVSSVDDRLEIDQQILEATLNGNDIMGDVRDLLIQIRDKPPALTGAGVYVTR